MSRTLTHQRAPEAAASKVTTSGAVIQRACACGGTPGPTGECEQGRRKRLRRRSAQHGPDVSRMPPIVHEALR